MSELIRMSRLEDGPQRDIALKHLADIPVIDHDAMIYWDAWHELNTERPSSMGIASIPLSAIIAYGRYYGFTLRETDELIHVVRALDNRFLTLRAEKDSKKAKEKPPRK